MWFIFFLQNTFSVTKNAPYNFLENVDISSGDIMFENNFSKSPILFQNNCFLYLKKTLLALAVSENILNRSYYFLKDANFSFNGTLYLKNCSRYKNIVFFKIKNNLTTNDIGFFWFLGYL